MSSLQTSKLYQVTNHHRWNKFSHSFIGITCQPAYPSYKAPLAKPAPLSISKTRSRKLSAKLLCQEKRAGNLLSICGSRSRTGTVENILFTTLDKDISISEGAKRRDNRSADANKKQQTALALSHRLCGTLGAASHNRQAQHLHKQGHCVSSTANEGPKKQEPVSCVERQVTFTLTKAAPLQAAH